MRTRYPIINRVSELKVHIELTRFVQPEKIEIDANERAVNEKSQYCFFVCTTFDSFLNDFSLCLLDNKLEAINSKVIFTSHNNLCFSLVNSLFLTFSFFIEIFSKSMSFPLAINHGYTDVQGTQNKTSSYSAMIGLSFPYSLRQPNLPCHTGSPLLQGP